MNDAIARLWRRLLLVVGRGRNTQVDDSQGAQAHQVSLGADELRDNTPRVAEYGFVSNPPPGTDVIMVFIAGERTNGVIVGTNNQTLRMRNLATGEVAIHDDKGRFVLLSAAGIHVQGKDDPIVVETTSDITATAGGNILAKATGDLTLQAGGTIKMQASTVDIETTTATTNAQTVITRASSVAIVAEVDITGVASILGDLINNGVVVGDEHEHSPGTFKVGGTPVTGSSGGVTP